MRFEWYENKRMLNLQRHGFDFVGVEAVFENHRYTFLDNRFDYGETRFVTFGFLENRVVAVVHSDTDEVTIIISVRKATRNEQRKLYQKISDRLGEN